MATHKNRGQLNALRADQASPAGLTSDGWDVEQTQRVLNAYLGSMSPQARTQNTYLPEKLDIDGVISNGRRGPEASTVTTFNTLDHFVHSALGDKYVPFKADPDIAKLGPAGTAKIQHQQAANLAENMQRMMGFLDTRKLGLTDQQVKDIKAGKVQGLPAALTQRPERAPMLEQQQQAIIDQIKAGHIVDGHFGPASKAAWDQKTHDPATMQVAQNLGTGNNFAGYKPLMIAEADQKAQGSRPAPAIVTTQPPPVPAAPPAVQDATIHDAPNLEFPDTSDGLHKAFAQVDARAATKVAAAAQAPIPTSAPTSSLAVTPENLTKVLGMPVKYESLGAGEYASDVGEYKIQAPNVGAAKTTINQLIHTFQTNGGKGSTVYPKIEVDPKTGAATFWADEGIFKQPGVMQALQKQQPIVAQSNAPIQPVAPAPIAQPQPITRDLTQQPPSVQPKNQVDFSATMGRQNVNGHILMDGQTPASIQLSYGNNPRDPRNPSITIQQRQDGVAAVSYLNPPKGQTPQQFQIDALKDAKEIMSNPNIQKGIQNHIKASTGDVSQVAANSDHFADALQKGAEATQLSAAQAKPAVQKVNRGLVTASQP